MISRRTFAIAAVAAFPLSLRAQEKRSGDRFMERNALAQTVATRLKHLGVGNDRYAHAVIKVLRATPRHLFVPLSGQTQAYDDRPLPIGHGQTISAPFIVALMTSLLRVGKRDRILEIGTGSGYQAAILSQLGAAVYSIEIVEPLAREAAERVNRLGYSNVIVRAGDGYAGWPVEQPFDAIIVTAGASKVPPALLAQLKPGGRMAIPLGPNWAQEELILIEKDQDGTLKQRSYGPVFFVDFTGEIKRSSGPR